MPTAYTGDHITPFVALGPETGVNQTTAGFQEDASVAALAGGNYLVTWEFNSQNGSDGVAARLYGPDGQALTNEIQVNQTAVASAAPQVVALPGGGALVVWRGQELYSRIIDSGGTPLGNEVVVNTSTAGTPTSFQIHSLESGDFFVTWEAADAQNLGVFGQRFDAQGAKAFGEVALNTTTALNQVDVDVTELSNGLLVAVWESQGQVGTTSDRGIYSQIITAGSGAQGVETKLVDEVGTNEVNPQVVALTGGGFVLLWEQNSEIYTRVYAGTGAAVANSTRLISDVDDDDGGRNPTIFALSDDRYAVIYGTNDGNGLAADLFYRVMNADGTTENAGAVETFGAGGRSQASVAMLDDGGWITTFTSGSGISLDVYVVRHAPDGTPVGDPMMAEYEVNTETSNIQFNSSVAVTDAGDVVVTWTSNLQDGSGTGVFSQRLAIPEIGTRGADTLDGTGGSDFLGGWVGADSINGQGGADRLEGGLGADDISGGRGADYILGGAGNDTGSGGDGADTITGGRGNDTGIGGSGQDLILGEEGVDGLFGGGGNDTLYGGAGRDTLQGGTGADELLGGGTNDFLRGQAGGDTLYGGVGADDLGGGAQGDTLFGAAGADTLRGDTGSDTLRGGSGNDTLYGGAGADMLQGQAGADSFIFSRGDGDDTVADFELGPDTLRLNDDLWTGSLTRAEVVATFASLESGDAVFRFDAGETLTVEGIASLSALQQDLIIF
ncbi:MAG: calcium-binding protein [Pseudomonadota bacterium]